MSITDYETYQPDVQDDEPFFDEHAVVVEAQNGCPEAYTKLYSRHYEAVYKSILGKLSDPQLAEDLAQETFIKMFTKIDKFANDGRPLASWLHSIASNLFIDNYRTQKRKPTASLDAMEPWVLEKTFRAVQPENPVEPTVLDKVEIEELMGILRESKIPQNMLEVWGLIELEDYANRDVEELKALPQGTVASRLARCRGKIRELVAQGVIEAPENATLGLRNTKSR